MKFIKLAVSCLIINLISCDKSAPDDTNHNSPRSSDLSQSCTQQKLIGTYDSNIIGEPEPSEPEKLVPSSEPQSLLAIHVPKNETPSEVLAPYIKNETLIIAVPSAQLHVDKSEKFQLSLALAPKAPSDPSLKSQTVRTQSEAVNKSNSPHLSAKQNTQNLEKTTNTAPYSSQKIETPQKEILSAGPTYEIAFRQSNLWKELRELGWQESIDLTKFRSVILKQIETSMASDKNLHASEFAEYTKIMNNWKKTWDQYAKDQLSTRDFQSRLHSSIENLSVKAENFQKVFLIDRLIIQEKIRQQYDVNLSTKVYSVFTTHWHKILTTVAATMGITGFIYNFIVLEKFQNSEKNENKEDEDISNDDTETEDSPEENEKSESDKSSEVADDSEQSVVPEELGTEQATVVEFTPTVEATAHPVDPETGNSIPEISIPLENRTAIGVENTSIIKEICQPVINQ